jgi:hypothetical protein
MNLHFRNDSLSPHFLSPLLMGIGAPIRAIFPTVHVRMCVFHIPSTINAAPDWSTSSLHLLLMVPTQKVTVIRALMPYSLIAFYQHFKVTNCLCLQGHLVSKATKGSCMELMRILGYRTSCFVVLMNTNSFSL